MGFSTKQKLEAKQTHSIFLREKSLQKINSINFQIEYADL